MRIVIGSGNNRNIFDVPAGPMRVLNKHGQIEVIKNKEHRVARERIAEDIKAFLFRPRTLQH